MIVFCYSVLCFRSVVAVVLSGYAHNSYANINKKKCDDDLRPLVRDNTGPRLHRALLPVCCLAYIWYVVHTR